LQLQESTFFFQLLRLRPGPGANTENLYLKLGKFPQNPVNYLIFIGSIWIHGCHPISQQHYCLEKTGPSPHQEFQIAHMRNKVLSIHLNGNFIKSSVRLECGVLNTGAAH
jgi:hypothetical protein